MAFGYKTALTIGKWVVIVLALMAVALYGALLVSERYPEPIRRGLEDALSETTGKRAQITDMVTVKMVPDAVLRMKGIDILDPHDRQKNFAHIDKAYLSAPAWRLFTGLQKYAGFEIQGLQTAAGFILPGKLDADFAGITDPNPGKTPAMFIIDGTYNKLPLLVTAEMERSQSGSRFLYGFGNVFPITFKLGDLEANGVFERSLISVSLKQVQVIRGPHKADFVLKDIRPDPVSGNAEGNIDGVEFGGTLSKAGDTVVFSITPKSTKAADIEKAQEFINLVNKDTGLGNKTDKFRIEIVKAAELESAIEKPQETEKK